MRGLRPEPAAAGAAGCSTVTPSVRSEVARSKAPGRPPAAAPAVPVVWAKSCPAFGRGICAAMTWPSRSVAATQ